MAEKVYLTWYRSWQNVLGTACCNILDSDMFCQHAYVLVIEESLQLLGIYGK